MLRVTAARIRSSAVILILVAFTVAPILHDVIPHSHGGDDHREGGSSSETAVWASLHSAARHEEKKILSLVTLDTNLVRITLVAITLAALVYIFFSTTLLIDPFRGRYLQRGIAPYRRFV